MKTNIESHHFKWINENIQLKVHIKPVMKLRLPNKIHTKNVDDSEFVRWFNAAIVDFSQSFSSGKVSHLLVFIIAGDLQKKNCAQNIQAFLWNFRQNTVCMAMETIHKLISSYKRVFWPNVLCLPIKPNLF